MGDKKQAAKISWNEKALAGISKRDFVAMFAKVYPEADLEKEFDALFPKKARAKTLKKKSDPESNPES